MTRFNTNSTRSGKKIPKCGHSILALALLLLLLHGHGVVEPRAGVDHTYNIQNDQLFIENVLVFERLGKKSGLS